MNVPKLRFKEFDGEWEEKKLKEVSTYSNGGSYENDVKSEGNYQLVTLKSVDMQGNLCNSGKYLDKEAPTLECGTLVMILSEQSPGLLGMTAQIPESNKYVLNQRVAEIKPNNNINSTFLSMVINRNQKYFSKKGAGTKVQNISKGNVENYEFYSPNFKEQEKIGHFFETLDKKIQLQQQKIDLLQEQKKGYMQKIFRQELKFKGERNKNYSDWNTYSLSELSIINPKSSNINDEFIYIDLESVKGGKLVQEKVILKEDAPSRAQRVIKNKDILYQMVRPYQKNNLIFEGECEKQIIASTGYAQIRVKENVNPVFIYYLMNTEEFTYRVLQRCTGTSYPAINSNDLSEIEIKVPVLEEQEKIAVFMCKLDKKIHLEYQKLELLYEQKMGFMQQMFI